MVTSALLLALALSAGKEPTRIAALQLEGSGVPPEMVETATILVPTEIRRARPDAQVLSSEDVRSLLTLQKNRVVLGGCADEACLVNLGGALGADEIVAGRLGRLGATWVLELRRVDVKKARNLASSTRAVKSAEALVEAVRSAAAELYAAAPPAGLPQPPDAPSSGPGPGPALPVIRAARPDDDSLPRPSLVDEDLDFQPIAYKGTRHRAVYDLVRRIIADARIPVDLERTDDDASLRLRTGWIAIEKGRRLRFRVRVDGQVGLDVDRERCDERGCAEVWDVSQRERKLAADLYGALRGPVERGRF